MIAEKRECVGDAGVVWSRVERPNLRLARLECLARDDVGAYARVLSSEIGEYDRDLRFGAQRSLDEEGEGIS